jgi:hypothetical protein
MADRPTTTPNTRQWVIEQSGVPGRQLDRWAARGWLRPAKAEPYRRRARRCWSEEEAVVAGLMARLVRAGIAVAVAAGLARKAAISMFMPGMLASPDLDQWVRIDMADGIRVEIKA